MAIAKFFILIIIVAFIDFLFRKKTTEGIEECKWSAWGSWSPCSEECGSGTQIRARANNGQCGNWPNNEQTQTRSCNVHPCPRGPVGPKGEKGIVGDRGPRGHMGEAGKSGGARGDVGDPGVQGPRGEMGDRGDRGLKGPVGERGVDGLVINRGNRMKGYLANIFNKLKTMSPEKDTKAHLIKMLEKDEGIEKMSNMEPFNTINYI